MKPLLLPGNVAVEKSDTLPFVTIALQIDPANISKAQMEQKIHLVIDKVENDLHLIDGIPDYIVGPAVNKLKNILNTLNYAVNKKSVIVFLSPFVEKIYYLNFLVQEKVVVGEPFNIRELICTKTEEIKHLVLSLHPGESHIYVAEENKLNRIVFNSVHQIKSHRYAGKEKFLEHVDNVLTLILKTYSLPLIAVGTEPVLSLFKSISKNSRELIGTIHSGNDSEDPLYIRELIKPVIQDWEKLKENYLLMKLDKASADKKMLTGIHKVSKTVKEKRGRLLIIEKDFYYSFRFTESNDIPFSKAVSSDGPLFVCDAVEDAVERVLAEGGDVEFVNPGVLKDHMHIALIV